MHWLKPEEVPLHSNPSERRQELEEEAMAIPALSQKLLQVLASFDNVCYPSAQKIFSKEGAAVTVSEEGVR